MFKFKMRSLAVILPAILLAGCGLPGGGLIFSAEHQLSNIIFGAPTQKAKHPAPAVGPEAPLPSPLYNPDQGFSQEAGLVYPYTYHPHAAAVDCPTAPPGSAAPEPAPGDASHAPQPGTYRWISQYVLNNSSTGRTVAASGGYENRYVRNVQTQPDTRSNLSSTPVHHYTFDTAQPDPLPSNPGGTVVISYAVSTSFSDVVYTAGTGTDPNAGVAIHQMHRFDKGGKLIESYEPTVTYSPQAGATADPNNPTAAGVFVPSGGTGNVLLFPLPVSIGSNNRWDFTGVDQKNQYTFELAGVAAGRRQLVDACGHYIEGWVINATVTVSKPDSTGTLRAGLQQKWSYVVATQWGGLIISMTMQGDTTEGTIQTAEKLASPNIGPLP